MLYVLNCRYYTMHYIRLPLFNGDIFIKEACRSQAIKGVMASSVPCSHTNITENVSYRNHVPSMP